MENKKATAKARARARARTTAANAVAGFSTPHHKKQKRDAPVETTPFG
jgi:hypothetical protein